MKIEIDSATNEKIMQIADRIGLKSDLFPQQVYSDTISFLISEFERLEPFKVNFEKLAAAETEKQKKIKAYSQKSLKELKKLGNKNQKGVARAKVIKAVHELMRVNDRAKKQDNKQFVTPSLVRKYLQDLSNTTRYSNIKEVCSDMQTEIDKHNDKHGLDKRHNARIAQAKRRAKEG